VCCRRCRAAASGWLGTSIPILLALTEGLVLLLTDVHRETKWGLGGAGRWTAAIGRRSATLLRATAGRGSWGAAAYSTPSILSSTSLQIGKRGRETEKGRGAE
jgi:hypothetical protein